MVEDTFMDSGEGERMRLGSEFRFRDFFGY